MSKAKKLRTWGNKRPFVRNSGRNNCFRKFIFEIYGVYLTKLDNPVVLDVGAGKGNLSFLLENLSCVRTVAIEPRELDFFKLMRKYQNGAFHKTFIDDLSVKKSDFQNNLRAVHHLKICLSDNFLESLKLELHSDSLVSSDFKTQLKDSLHESSSLNWSKKGLTEHEDSVEDIETCKTINKTPKELVKELKEANEIVNIFKRTALVIGMHPDQATGVIVKLANILNVPFAVVPCCVYYKEFTKRKLNDGTLVKNYDQLKEFIKQQGDNVQEKVLEFGGKNCCIFQLPKQT